MTDAGVFEAERDRLVGIAYRMLGDVGAAEDVAQDAFLRWTSRADDEVRSPAAFLTTITTRLAIDRLRAAHVRREAYVGPWLAEPVLFDPPSDAAGPDDAAALAESVTLGFLLLLDVLSPTERAVFLLHDVFDYRFAEIAVIVDKTEPACRQLGSRARAKVAEHRATVPRRRAQSEREAELMSAFGLALAEADVDNIQALLTDDVVTTSDGGGVKHAAMRPVVGRERVARFFAGIAKKAPPDVSVELASVNGEPAFLVFFGSELDVAVVVGATDAGIDHVHAVRNPAKLEAVHSGYRLAI